MLKVVHCVLMYAFIVALCFVTKHIVVVVIIIISIIVTISIKYDTE